MKQKKVIKADCAFFALAFENELEYYYLYVHVNSGDDYVMFPYYLQGGDTAAPSGLYAPLPDLQSIAVFRAHHSTETAVLKVMSDILLALDSGNQQPMACTS